MATSRGSDTGAEDADIAAALRAGDRRGALTLLMTRYGQRVYRHALAMTHDRQLADEVRQQVFVEAHRDLETFAWRSSIRSWLFGIARHRSLDAAKKQRRWQQRFKNEPPPEPCLEADPADRLDARRLAKIIERCLQTLAPAARDAVILRHTEGLSYDEMSRIVGDLAGTLQQRVARALPVLRRCVEKRGSP